MSITGQTRLLGLLGWPVSHSLSPAMHNAAAAALQLDVVYLPLAVMPERVEEALHGLVAFGFLGVNVTVPHKQAVMPFLGSIESAARAIGAVNTIKVALDTDDGRRTTDRRNPQSPISNLHSPISNLQSPISSLHGFNTDWSGFLADLQARDISIAGRDCLILGAGGSARAVAYALAREGGRVTLFARRAAQAEGLVNDLGAHVPDATLKAAAWQQLSQVGEYRAPLIVNTTPVGMHPNEDASPWPEGLPFPQNAEVYDLIYNPAETRLIRQARTAGCQTFNGLGMLLQQGALAFEIWLGVKPSLEVMARALRELGVVN